jgi:hypothetical protein
MLSVQNSLSKKLNSTSRLMVESCLTDMTAADNASLGMDTTFSRATLGLPHTNDTMIDGSFIVHKNATLAIPFSLASESGEVERIELSHEH